MNPTTVRRISERDAIRGPRQPLLRWAAVFLAILTIGAAAWLLSRDVGWENRRREAKALAQAAAENGNFQSAKQYYLVALANQPYDWESHMALARIDYLRLSDFESALRHYLYALAYTTNQPVAQEAREEIEILRLIRLGELENPRDALEDMFLAAEEGAERMFITRLSPELAEDAESYWQAWSGRGRGELRYCRIRKGNDGFFDANIELHFPDETTMSMHFYCVKGTVWRLELSFP